MRLPIQSCNVINNIKICIFHLLQSFSFIRVQNKCKTNWETNLYKTVASDACDKQILVTGVDTDVALVSSANCGAKASLPAFPLPLKLQDRMAVIYSVLSLSIAAR